MTHTAYHTRRYHNQVLGFRPSVPQQMTKSPASRPPAESITSHSRLVASGREPKYVVVQSQ